MLTAAAILFGLLMAGEVATLGRRKAGKRPSPAPVRRATWDAVKNRYEVTEAAGPDVADDKDESAGCGLVFAFVVVGFLCYVFYFVMLPAAWGN